MKIKRCLKILRRTGALKIFTGFVLFMCAVSVILKFIEPDIHTVGDGFWYCFVAATTIGFGDICVATHLGRFLTILVGIYGIFVAALVPGVVVSYYMEYLKISQSETVSIFLEKLEHLPELSESELAELSDKIKEFNKKH